MFHLFSASFGIPLLITYSSTTSHSCRVLAHNKGIHGKVCYSAWLFRKCPPTRSAFTSGYMDDIVLGGNIRDVARDTDDIRTEGEAIELFLNN